MSKLYLLRHAKAGWALPGMRDFDRPLDATGVRDAAAMGLAMRERGYVPDLTLCSTAVRARQTLEGVAAQADTGRVVLLDALYSGDAAGYLSAIRDHDGRGSLLVVGHNPTMEDLAIALAGSGDAEALASLSAGFPTSGLAVLEFETELRHAAPGKGKLTAFLSPALL
ncbi:histidine phosphatase family protein [Mesorhizobium sp. LHD-90]|uniref:SixA phosphatase family protein n=1 Tax=Mesorhizobium sp. LHD-90 TaxID=3071414 RepID=UPI0027E0994B|nr:histidine phosphatase family protein [Mesorhizobium sp. LHD-90]MDQ6437844.1 histidine phosphatase family protein [Mesorhizobium sp. LHD-90]